jgi:hypothetical protein
MLYDVSEYAEMLNDVCFPEGNLTETLEHFTPATGTKTLLSPGGVIAVEVENKHNYLTFETVA